MPRQGEVAIDVGDLAVELLPDVFVDGVERPARFVFVFEDSRPLTRPLRPHPGHAGSIASPLRVIPPSGAGLCGPAVSAALQL